jgi:hypothetical protein
MNQFKLALVERPLVLELGSFAAPSEAHSEDFMHTVAHGLLKIGFKFVFSTSENTERFPSGVRPKLTDRPTVLGRMR